MKLDKRLELLAMLALVGAGGEYESDEVDNMLGSIVEEFELEEDSIPNIDTVSILLQLRDAVNEIQDMIDEYNGFEREEETLH